MSNVALGGADGKIGSKIYEELVDQGRDVVGIGPERTIPKISAAPRKIDAEVYVDVTRPDQVLKNIEGAFERGLDVVVGTTGWYDQMPKVEEMTEEYGRTLLYGANFGEGANRFISNAKDFARRLDEDWDVAIEERHHTGKRDPSGTAIILANKIMEVMPGKTEIAHNPSSIEDYQIGISSSRIGNEPGKHKIIFRKGDEQITMEQQNSRDALVKGAINAIYYVIEHPGEGKVYEYASTVLGL